MAEIFGWRSLSLALYKTLLIDSSVGSKKLSVLNYSTKQFNFIAFCCKDIINEVERTFFYSVIGMKL